MGESALAEERAPQAPGAAYSGRSLAILLLCAVMMLVEGFDLAAMPLVVPIASAEIGVAPAAFAWSLSAVIVGIGLAAVLLAPLGERFGRRPTIIVSALLLACMTFGTATATNPTTFTIWRLLTGLALGTCLPNTTAVVAAIAPDRLRVRVLTLVTAGVPVGSVVAGLAAGTLSALGGAAAFFIAAAAITLLAALAFVVVLPKSRSDASRAPRGASQALPVLLPLRAPFRSSTLTLLALGTCNTFLIYMLISWLPTLLPRIGVSVATAARLSTLVQVGGLLGGLAYSWLIDRGWARPTFLGGYILAIVALLLLAMMPGIALSAALLVLVGIGISGAHTTITNYGIGLFPLTLVSSYLGLSIAVTRFGAILGPIAGGGMVGRGGIAPFTLVAATIAALCFLCVLAIPRSPARGQAA